MNCGEQMVRGHGGSRRTPAEYRHRALANRIGRSLLGGLFTILTALAVLSAALTGCSTSRSTRGKATLGPLLPKETESKAEKDALKKAVDKDPFPRARSRPVDLDA